MINDTAEGNGNEAEAMSSQSYLFQDMQFHGWNGMGID